MWGNLFFSVDTDTSGTIRYSRILVGRIIASRLTAIFIMLQSNRQVNGGHAEHCSIKSMIWRSMKQKTSDNIGLVGESQREIWTRDMATEAISARCLARHQDERRMNGRNASRLSVQYMCTSENVIGRNWMNGNAHWLWHQPADRHRQPTHLSPSPSPSRRYGTWTSPSASNR